MITTYGGEWRCQRCRIGWQVMATAADARDASRSHATAYMGHWADWRGHDGSICQTCKTTPPSTFPVPLPDGLTASEPTYKWPSTTGSTDDR